MKVFAVTLNINGARWVDSQYVSEKAADERRLQVAASYRATNQTSYSLEAKVVPFQIEDARLAPENGAVTADQTQPEANQK